MNRLPLIILSLLCACGSHLFAFGQEQDALCGDIYTEHSGGPRSRDPVAEMGGLQNIDKIIAIEVDTAHNLLFCTDLRGISRFATTYRLMDGSTRRFVYGGGGHCQSNDLPVINIPEDVYLTKIIGYDGTPQVSWVELTMSDGSVWRPFNQPARPDPNFERSADKAVIKALTFDSGNVVDGVGAYFEYNRVLRYEMEDDVVVEQLGGTELKDNGVDIDGSQEGVLNVFDNLDGDTVLSYDKLISQKVREWETRTVTSTRQTDVTFNLNIVGIYKGVKAEADFFVGHSTSETVVEDEGFENERILEEQLAFDVLPGTKKIVHLSYRTYNYEYRFSGTAGCVYQSEPDIVYPGGLAEGELQGIEALSGINIEIDTESKDDVDVGNDEEVNNLSLNESSAGTSFVHMKSFINAVTIVGFFALVATAAA